MGRNRKRSGLLALSLIAIGGFAGSNLRYLFDIALPATLVGTFLVNVVGCGLLGFFIYEKQYTGAVGERMHLVLLTGFISSFTTYSTFVVDAVQSSPTIALAYVGATYAVGFLAVGIGRQTAAMVATRTDRPGDERLNGDIDSLGGEGE